MRRGARHCERMESVATHKCVQSIDSICCGQYVLSYILIRCRGHSMQRFVNVLGRVKPNNDNIVKIFIKECFNFW